MTGGRIERLRPFLDDRFLLTYGDGLSNVPIDQLVARHEEAEATVTVTAVSPPPRFGALEVVDGQVRSFAGEAERSARPNQRRLSSSSSRRSSTYLTGDDCVFETGPLSTLARAGGLAAYVHDGFWMAMDTVRERDVLNRLAQEDRPPWTR